MRPAPNSAMVRVDVPLRPDELVAAWRPDTRRLMLPAPGPLRLEQRVAARITLLGPGVAATVTGRVVSASRHGAVDRIELLPDEMRLRAVQRLLSAARGERVEHSPRAPRFLATMPAVVYGPKGPTFMTTFSVSERGCGLAWSGPVPAVGIPMEVRLGAGNRVAAFRSVVAWIAQSGRTATVGVRFVAGATSAWASMLTDVRTSGAPPS